MFLALNLFRPEHAFRTWISCLQLFSSLTNQGSAGKHRSATAVMVAGFLLPHLYPGQTLDIQAWAPSWADRLNFGLLPVLLPCVMSLFHGLDSWMCRHWFSSSAFNMPDTDLHETDLRPLLEAVHELRATPDKSSSSTNQPDEPIEKVAWSGDESNCEMNQSSSQYYHFPVTALDSSCQRSIRATTRQDTANQHVRNPQVKQDICAADSALYYCLRQMDIDSEAWIVPGLTVYSLIDTWLMVTDWIL